MPATRSSLSSHTRRPAARASELFRRRRFSSRATSMSAPEWLRNKQGGAFGGGIDQAHHRILNAFERWTQGQANSRWLRDGFCEFDLHQINLTVCWLVCFL